jgi:16S rRNA (guanine1516-N2)-methyltransferase
MNPLIKTNIQTFEKENWPEVLTNFLAKNSDLFNFTSEMKADEDYLIFKSGKLSYFSVEMGEMFFDFEADLRYHGRQNYAISKEPLARALGLVGHPQKTIWDATCGTGQDALLISFFKGKLVAFERHPAIFLLLQDAKIRSSVDFDIVFADPSMSTSIVRPEVIYYDPMYPEKKKSALARKEMRIFKKVVGEDQDSENFLAWALTMATDRVVVKRPLHAIPIKNNPDASYKGKSTRYDMYKIF